MEPHKVSPLVSSERLRQIKHMGLTQPTRSPTRSDHQGQLNTALRITTWQKKKNPSIL